MSTIHTLGFPRIGPKRELKFACESYWRGDTTEDELENTAKTLRQQNWQRQLDAGIDWLPVGDFSLYDHVLDTSFLVGHLPKRFHKLKESSEIERYFAVARGFQNKADEHEDHSIAAGEMTKWFDTNYHYIVPEFDAGETFKLNPKRLLQQVAEARKLSAKIKPVILGPLSYLWLGKSVNEQGNKLELLPALLPIYQELISLLANEGVQWLQIDEPVLVLDLPQNWLNAFESSYHRLQSKSIQVLLATYFGPLQNNLNLLNSLPVAGIHLDAIRGREDLNKILDILPPHKILSVGVVDGRNIWANDLNKTLGLLKKIQEKLGDRLWLAPSCSLLHVPVDLNAELKLDEDLQQWLAFAQQKLEELNILKQALSKTDASVEAFLKKNQKQIDSRTLSNKIHNPTVKQAVEKIDSAYSQRKSEFIARAEIQQSKYKLPVLPTTTIGSFPQTQEIRATRKQYKTGEINSEEYKRRIETEIQRAVYEQEKLNLDVLVHGEAERNDMVEYFGEQLQGYAFTQYGWVQSYGSRCVKPPIIYGDVCRPNSMTVDWTRYAQSLSTKPVKGMLTGPITMLQWAFVRDDQTREITAKQIALALREEVLELEKAGINFIQVDEPALREGLPLRKNDWQHYLNWAVEAFKISTCAVADSTQIHTHMCYAEFNDIIQAIAALDADVITIETSRSNMELLKAFEDFKYPNGIGPGVYDIHSPNVPAIEHIENLLKKAGQKIPLKQLWVNPDCGLKTRNWEEVIKGLGNMMKATEKLRAEFSA